MAGFKGSVPGAAKVRLNWICNRDSVNTATNRDARYYSPDAEPDNRCTPRCWLPSASTS